MHGPIFLAWGVDAATRQVFVVCMVNIHWVHLVPDVCLADRVIKRWVLVHVVTFNAVFICTVAWTEHVDLIVYVWILTGELMVLTSCAYRDKASIKVGRGCYRLDLTLFLSLFWKRNHSVWNIRKRLKLLILFKEFDFLSLLVSELSFNRASIKSLSYVFLTFMLLLGDFLWIFVNGRLYWKL